MYILLLFAALYCEHHFIFISSQSGPNKLPDSDGPGGQGESLYPRISKVVVGGGEDGDDSSDTGDHQPDAQPAVATVSLSLLQSNYSIPVYTCIMHVLKILA